LPHPELVKAGVDVVYASVFVILCGLMVRVSSGRAPAWYEEGEKKERSEERWEEEKEREEVRKKRWVVGSVVYASVFVILVGLWSAWAVGGLQHGMKRGRKGKRRRRKIYKKGKRSCG
jgi:hypothetical protein